MLKTNLKSARQAGFTLVELAIVMIIIGLLIGGVLKGQELIANAQITSTVAQIKGVDAATTTFRDMFSGMPGDIVGPNNRLPNCTTAPCSVAGNGDGRINNAVNGQIAFTAAPTTAEQRGFWAHLNRADLISGVNPGPAATDDVWGRNFPAAEIGGGLHVGYFGGGAGLSNVLLNGAAAAGVRAGHYLALHNTQAGAVANTGFLTPNQAFRIDSKMDDGVPGTGSVLANGNPTCVLAAVGYNEASANSLCGLYLRFQN